MLITIAHYSYVYVNLLRKGRETHAVEPINGHVTKNQPSLDELASYVLYN